MESEACVLAATRISSEQLQRLKYAVEDMRAYHAKDDIVGFKYASAIFIWVLQRLVGMLPFPSPLSRFGILDLLNHRLVY